MSNPNERVVTPSPVSGSGDDPLPAPGAFDAHTHMDVMGLPVDGVLAAARAAGISRVVNVGCDIPSSEWSAARAAEYPDVYAAVAIHPNETSGVDSRRDEVLASIEALAAAPKVVAIGETGLDYYRDWSPREVQRAWFGAHIELARRTGKTLMIHDREAHADVLRILAEEGPPARVVFHCFSGDAALAKQCAEAGYVMSFAGNLTFTNARPLRDAAAAAPPELLLAETDAPFLTPVPNRGRPNEPAQVAYTLRCLAEVQGLDLAGLCDTVTATAERIFGPW